MRRALTLFLFFGVGLAAQRLTTPSQMVTVDPSFLPTSFPKWDRGFLVGYDFNRATVFAADRAGKTVFQTRIWPENGDIVHITDLATSPLGGFAVSLTVTATTGVGTGAIAWLDAMGKSMRLVQLPMAAAFNVCFANDGTLWALVRVHDEKGIEAVGYDILRHYDANGVLIGTALPRSKFVSKRFPASGMSFMAASKDHIGIYFDVSKNWVELSYSGSIAGHWILPASDLLLSRAFLTDGNDVYFQCDGKTSTELGIRHLNKTANTLMVVDASALAGYDSSVRSVRLIGGEGNDIVVRKSSLMWVTAQ